MASVSGEDFSDSLGVRCSYDQSRVRNLFVCCTHVA